MVLTAGQAEEKRREKQQEVKAANNTVAKLQEDLRMLTGEGVGNQNMWQLGVPYGSKAGRFGGPERDRFGRPIQSDNRDQRRR